MSPRWIFFLSVSPVAAVAALAHAAPHPANRDSPLLPGELCSLRVGPKLHVAAGGEADQ